MQVKLIVLRDTQRTYKDRSGQTVTRREVHAFPAPDDGAKREMTLLVPPEVPPLTPYQTYTFAVEDWRAFEGEVTFTARPVEKPSPK
jgi:hypothetical protein